MRWMKSRIMCTLIAPLAFAASAVAADYDDEPYPPAVVYAPPPVYVPVPPYARTYYYRPPVAVYDPRPRLWYSHPPAAYYEYVPQPLEWVPPRPRSCGKYRYWNGDYCADARFRRPYVGPRW